MLRKYQAKNSAGRKSVAAERYNPEEDDDEPLKVVPKSDEQRKRLKDVSDKIMLLNRLDEVKIFSAIPKLKIRTKEQLTNVINAMEERKIQVDDIVIKQGDDGDNFYVIDRYVKRFLNRLLTSTSAENTMFILIKKMVRNWCLRMMTSVSSANSL